MTDKINKETSKASKWAFYKLIGTGVLILVFVGFFTLIGLPSLDSELGAMKSDPKNFQDMLVVAEDLEDSPEKADFVAYTTKAVEDDYMDASERKKASSLYIDMLNTIELPECMHPLLKKTVGSYLREDLLNSLQKKLDDKPCEI